MNDAISGTFQIDNDDKINLNGIENVSKIQRRPKKITELELIDYTFSQYGFITSYSRSSKCNAITLYLQQGKY